MSHSEECSVVTEGTLETFIINMRRELTHETLVVETFVCKETRRNRGTLKGETGKTEEQEAQQMCSV